jgi:hypothetical protein
MASSRRDQRADGPLYTFLSDVFPTYRTILGKFDVLRMAQELHLSHEAVYKWLRKREGRCLTPQNADRILELALQEANADVLRKTGVPRPTIRDFDIFVYGRAT